MTIKNFTNPKGFTLVELLTSVALFMVVMTISMGSILGVFDANKKAESLKTAMDNLNFSLESMSREMRFGRTYHCGPNGVTTDAQNCPGGDSYIAFKTSDEIQTIYKKLGTQIVKSIDGGTTFIPVTAPEVIIQSLTFYVIGAGLLPPADKLQPKILMQVRGTAGTNAKSTTDFTIETLVSQRLLDI